MGKAIIDEETLTGIADAIRTRKGTSGLIPTPNMKDEILSISGGGSVTPSDFYTVNFYDENKDLIQNVCVRKEITINPPNYNCAGWYKDNADNIETFPIQLTDNVDYYAIAEITYADQIYAAADLNKADYPYVMVVFANDAANRVYFAKQLPTFSSDGSCSISAGIMLQDGTERPSNYYDLNEVTPLAIATVDHFDHLDLPSMDPWETSIFDHEYWYSNFEAENASDLIRLDVSVES